ncbi:MAG: hypothetical protein H6837_08735 [Planctomycetes bacterium]|nr:hypothetical protein [Planctomycetota bacterium]
MCADAEIHILDVIDVSKEIAKLQKQRAKLEGQLGALRKKLDNPGFLAKAPADVVERERGTLAQLEIDLSRTDESLQQLATE